MFLTPDRVREGFGVSTSTTQVVISLRRLTWGLILVLIVLVGEALTGCGGAGGGTRRLPPFGPATVVEHITTVSRKLGPLDSDDNSVREFGRAATGAEAGKMTALLKRYYDAAASSSGVRACSMLYSVAAKEIVEEASPNSEDTRANTCSAAMSKRFAATHRQFVAEQASLKAVRFRTDGLNGRVMLRFSGFAQARLMDLRFVDGRWKVARPVDGPMP